MKLWLPTLTKDNKTNVINNEFYFLNIITDSKENSTEKKVTTFKDYFMYKNNEKKGHAKNIYSMCLSYNTEKFKVTNLKLKSKLKLKNLKLKSVTIF